MGRCDKCGKGLQVGMNVSHSHVRTKKRSYPNLHSFKIKKSGVTRRLHFCTKCLRIVKKETGVSKPTIPQEKQPTKNPTPT
jgi:large subunit ribosomal protein L28